MCIHLLRVSLAMWHDFHPLSFFLSVVNYTQVRVIILRSHRESGVLPMSIREGWRVSLTDQGDVWLRSSPMQPVVRSTEVTHTLGSVIYIQWCPCSAEESPGIFGKDAASPQSASYSDHPNTLEWDRRLLLNQWNCVSLRTLMMEKVRRVIPSAAPALTSRCVMLEVPSANVARLSSTCFLQLGLGLGWALTHHWPNYTRCVM